MEKLFTVFVLIFSILITSACCNTKQPYEIAVINIRYEGFNIGSAEVKIIETPKEDFLSHIDTSEYGRLSSPNNYTFQLELDKYKDHGNYLIWVESISQLDTISNVEINLSENRCGDELDSYYYEFNGVQKSNKNREILIIN